MTTETEKRAGTIVSRCRELARFTEAPGQIQRTFLSPVMRECMQKVGAWMTAAGMHVSTDAAGNLRGRYPASSPQAPSLVIGSHLDTVPDGGAFDGMLGVMLGLSLVEALQGEPLPFAIEVIGFSEEEGVRFSTPFIGSCAVAGSFPASMLEKTDRDGVTVSEALRSFGLDPSRIHECALGTEAAAYLEFHIEQGAVLESEDRPLGVVNAIVGQSRAECIFTGLARHAGTTPMHLRNDAVAGAAEWICAVEKLAQNTTGLVATVGDVKVQPGAVNVVAGQARVTLDVRHAQDAVRQGAASTLLQQAARIAQQRGLTLHSKMQMDQPAVAMDPRLCELTAQAIRNAGVAAFSMVSGAGHDAMVMAARVPATMIFLRSPGGISHHPDEQVLVEDVAHAFEAGLAFLRIFPDFLEPTLKKAQSTPHV